jgi:serine/threonine protein kinase
MTQSSFPSFIGPYQFLESIGSGAYSFVSKAIHITSHSLVAIKVIPKRHLPSTDQLSTFHREVNIMKTLDHPFIASVFEILEDDRYFYLSLEYASSGSLFNRLNKRNGFSESECHRIFYQLVLALDYIHNQRRVVHRDLKAENILLDDFLNIRLCDFGFARSFTKLHPLMQTTCGSPLYMAPEVLSQESYTSAADVWSAGVLLYTMLVGKFPFRASSLPQLINEIRTGTPEMPRYLSHGAVSLLMKLLNKNPRARLSVSSILQDSWLVEGRSLGNEMAMLAVLKVHDVRVLDDSVIEEMRKMGYEVEGLCGEVIAEVLNERTAVYRMLRKGKVMLGVERWQECSRKEMWFDVKRPIRRKLPPLRISGTVKALPAPDRNRGFGGVTRCEVIRSSVTPPPLAPNWLDC